MCLMLQLLTQMAFFFVQHLFFTSAEQAYLEQTDLIYSLKNPMKQEVFLSKTKSILTGKLGA
jgi:hypothetical protein